MSRSGADVVPTAVCLLVAALALLAAADSASAQLRASYTRGQDVSPAFEGWEENADGSFSLVFGYMNRNWEEEIQVPVGADNAFSPGPADRGQPTVFLPRRNRFVFKVRVPADFGEEELVWTLTAHGRTEKAFGSLARDYRIDHVVIMSETGALGAGSSNEEIRSNLPPTVELDGEQVRHVRVGEPLTLAVQVTDDGLPRPRGFSRPRPDATPEQLLARALRPSVRVTVNKAVGLHFAWFLYRSPGAASGGVDGGAGRPVSITPAQIKTWEDTRPFANSPWAPFWVPPTPPEDGRWTNTVTFDRAGTWTLRGRADDGGLYADLDITVVVSP